MPTTEKYYPALSDLISINEINHAPLSWIFNPAPKN